MAVKKTKPEPAAYMRYSSEGQRGSCSIELQREAILKHAGLKTIREYVDEARTGRTAVGRDALQQLMADVESGRVSVVYVYKYDRFSRHLATAAAMIEQVQDEFGVEVISATEPKEELVRNIMLCVGQDYSRVLGQRCRAGMQERFKQGGFTGGCPPLGYRVVDDGELKRLAIDEEEAAVVRQLFTLYADNGTGLYTLAKTLNAKGLRTRKKTLYSATSISKILRNPIYVGRRTWGKRRGRLNRATGRATTVETPEATIVDERPELRILDEALWKKVQRRLKSRSHIGVRKHLGKVSAFTSLITCGVCGSRVFTKKTARSQGAQRYLTCGRRLRYGKDTCGNSKFYREERLMARVQETFRLLFDSVEELIEPILAETRALVENNQSALKTAKAQAARLEGEIERLSALAADAETPDAAGRAFKEQVAKRYALLEQTREQINSVAESSMLEAENLEKAVRQAFEEVQADLRNANTVPQLHEFLAKYVGPMILRSDGTIVQADVQAHAAVCVSDNHAPPDTTVKPAPPSSSPNRSDCSSP